MARPFENLVLIGRCRKKQKVTVIIQLKKAKVTTNIQKNQKRKATKRYTGNPIVHEGCVKQTCATGGCNWAANRKQRR